MEITGINKMIKDFVDKVWIEKLKIQEVIQAEGIAWIKLQRQYCA